MEQQSKVIFGNEMSKKDVKKAEKTKSKFLKKYGDDSKKDYEFALKENAVLAPLGTKELVFGEGAAVGITRLATFGLAEIGTFQACPQCYASVGVLGLHLL